MRSSLPGSTLPGRVPTRPNATMRCLGMLLCALRRPRGWKDAAPARNPGRRFALPRANLFGPLGSRRACRGQASLPFAVKGPQHVSPGENAAAQPRNVTPG